MVQVDKGLEIVDPNCLKERLLDLRVWHRKGQRAPHKPLLVLWAMGRCLRGEPRLGSYEETATALRKLLQQFGPPSKTVHPEHPFWRLRNDKVWQVPGEANIALTSRGDAQIGSLREQNAHGGFTREVYAQLANEKFALEIALNLLEAHFPHSQHDEILQAVGMPVQADDDWIPVRRRPRDSSFSGNVLKAYGHRCAVCSFSVQINNQAVALDAAHIKWHKANGPDQVPNGLALCSLHHRLFDAGAFTLCEDRKIRVSKSVAGERTQESLRQFDTKRIWLPELDSHFPALEFLKWHQCQVFKRY